MDHRWPRRPRCLQANPHRLYRQVYPTLEQGQSGYLEELVYLRFFNRGNTKYCWRENI